MIARGLLVFFAAIVASGCATVRETREDTSVLRAECRSAEVQQEGHEVSVLFPKRIYKEKEINHYSCTDHASQFTHYAYRIFVYAPEIALIAAPIALPIGLFMDIISFGRICSGDDCRICEIESSEKPKTWAEVEREKVDATYKYVELGGAGRSDTVTGKTRRINLDVPEEGLLFSLNAKGRKSGGERCGYEMERVFRPDS